MATSVVLLWIVTVVVAQHDDFTVDFPLDSQVLPTDNSCVEWSYDFYYKGRFTIELLPTDATEWEGSVFSTTVYALDSSTTLPTSILPAVRPNRTSTPEMRFYTMDG
ncbi:hypothetical protein BDW59DRAFT_158282 [Aspergillus cavernicola]|uniref:Uncharacterized protein n=1 Tax=Aspergillus cavernicola TaxID=176166 RepID=A0ABR4ISV8_9EURO